jgi:uncharacterized protein (DUF885 family)
MDMLKRLWFLLPLLFLLVSPTANLAGGDQETVKALCDEYIEAWKRFYPSRAFSLGFHASVFSFEDYSPTSVQSWIEVNRTTLEQINRRQPSLDLHARIDARLLRIQIRTELDRWENESPHTSSATFYSRSIGMAVADLVGSELLLPGEKLQLIRDRLVAVRKLVASAKAQLKEPLEAKANSLKSLEESARFYEQELVQKAGEWISGADLEELKSECLRTAEEVRTLMSFLEEKTESDDTNHAVLGREAFARKLEIATDSDLPPEALEAMALEEIYSVRALMVAAAAQYLGKPVPVPADSSDGLGLLETALQAMEADYPTNQQEYLELWQELTRRAESFVRQAEIASLPESSTLSIKLAPESAGEMTRIGWVSPAPAFAPNPWTTIFLPNIPDSFPEAERHDFWRSFNNYFTRFIVIHELYPGHYIQNRINRENPHTVRILFPYPLYSEGWATLCEKVALDAGWDSESLLTRLAQLRKRLENANRAYTSVQVHCRGWSQEQVMKFSTETSLVAPQFAKSLWYRLLRSPLQITTYFLGNRELLQLLEAERARRGESFQIGVFLDTILRAGPIPLDELPAVFEEAG